MYVYRALEQHLAQLQGDVDDLHSGADNEATIRRAQVQIVCIYMYVNMYICIYIYIYIYIYI